MKEPALRPATLLRGQKPIEVARQLRTEPGFVFLDSAGHLPSNEQPAISIIAARPTQLLRGSIHQEADRRILKRSLEMAANASPASAGDFDLKLPAGGLCGWVDYEGKFVFGEYPEMLISTDLGDWFEIGRLSESLREMPSAKVHLSAMLPNSSRERFTKAVHKALEWIRSGDIYQVNLSHTYHAEVRGGSLFELYEHLRDVSPAPMAAWLDLDGREVISSSPETFLRVSGQEIVTLPIKGTRPRYATASADQSSAHELQTSPKELAELVMITDLLRNDLGKVCDYGTVIVDELAKLESLAQVHHLVSKVSGRLQSEIGAIDALATCFPGGSVTGAPKRRAMEIIHELEDRPRGIYCGAIGYLGYNGESQFSIPIRTLVREGDMLNYHVGAGIVADSIPDKEYDETLHKAEGMRLALERFGLTI